MARPSAELVRLAAGIGAVAAVVAVYVQTRPEGDLFGAAVDSPQSLTLADRR